MFPAELMQEVQKTSTAGGQTEGSGIFQLLGRFNCKNLYFYHDPKQDLKAIIAVHSTRLGPALGGCRLASYKSEQAAVADAIGLARGMSYKAAIHRLEYGGGKAVLIRPESGIVDRAAYFESFGRFIESLNGLYITAVDSGTSVEDMDCIGRSTRFVTSTSKSSEGSGDPSPFTARGVLNSILAATQVLWQTDDLRGFRVAIQGVGHVGYQLAKLLHSRGAELFVSNRSAEKAERCRREFGASVIDAEQIHRVECEIFSPCALSGALSEKVVIELRCRLVAGAANIQLASADQGRLLHQRGILYLPDYVINAGGLMHVTMKYQGLDDKIIEGRVDEIGVTVSELIQRAIESGRPTSDIADEMAEENLRHGARARAGRI